MHSPSCVNHPSAITRARVYRQMLPANLSVTSVGGTLVGTVAGNWSVAELIDLVAAQDTINAQLNTAYQAFASTWNTKDATANADFATDLAALNTRYQAARQVAENAVTVASAQLLTPNSLIPAQSEYVGILTALNPNYPNAYGKGAYDDLDARLRTAGATVTYTNIPQPSAGTDADLGAMNTATQTLQAVGVPNAVLGLQPKPGMSTLEIVALAALGVAGLLIVGKVVL